MNDDNSLGGMLSEVLHLITGNKILDVGTGFGIVVGKLMERSDTQVFSVDPITSATPEALKILFYVNPLTYIADVVRAGYISRLYKV